jgi:signal transduction histidine kinase
MNAYKYTPKEGSVNILVRQDGKHVKIDISDTGYGIPQGEQKKISEKFFRGSNVINKKEEGNGIGLNMVYSLVKIIGGTITFVSQENTGTTFSLTLPGSIL